MKITFCLAIFLCGLKAQSQTVVYAGSNRAFGVCWGGGNINNTNQCAYNKAVNEGATNPQRILSYAGKGYGAIVRSANGAIGCSAGARTPQDAINLAIDWCKREGGDGNFNAEMEWDDRY
ncbi:MAG: hypothetical protein JSS93_04730 [Bacteroidetes bacterium]|nr:hypothetical protein [Bacteroidota bacterium]